MVLENPETLPNYTGTWADIWRAVVSKGLDKLPRVKIYYEPGGAQITVFMDIEHIQKKLNEEKNAIRKI